MSFTVKFFVFMLPFMNQGNNHVTWNAIPFTQPQHKIMFIWRQVTRGKTSMVERPQYKPQRWTHPCRRCLSSNIFQEKMSQNITCPTLYSRHSIIQPICSIRNTTYGPARWHIHISHTCLHSRACYTEYYTQDAVHALHSNKNHSNYCMLIVVNWGWGWRGHCF